MVKGTHLRVARPTDHLDEVIRFYRDGLGLVELGSFTDHAGFDGVYIPDTEQWSQTIKRMRDAGYEPVSSYNPYWEARGRTFEDPDGYRVVLQNAAWNE